MQDPHHFAHQSYLNDLEALMSHGQKQPVQDEYTLELKDQVRGMAALAALVVAVAFIPWSDLLV